MSRIATIHSGVLFLALAVCFLCPCNQALAQNNGAVVQLPTFSYFTTATTVSVPDRGSAFLGGIKRASTGRQEFGTPLLPFKNRAFGTERNVASQHVTVQVHDFESMDEYLLNQPPRVRTPRGPMMSSVSPMNRYAPIAQAALAPAPNPRWQASSGSAATPVMSVARAKALHTAEMNAKMLEICRQGYRAEQAGRYDVARDCYQTAVRQAQGELHGKIVARLDVISAKMVGETYARDTSRRIPVVPE